MPSRGVIVKGKTPSRGRNEESDVFSDFSNLSLADRHVPGRSYAPGTYYSSSEPRRETRIPGRAYNQDPPPPKSYHGPHFERSLAQEQLWDARKGRKEIWDPSKPMGSHAPRPETHGRAHSIHEQRREHTYSDPYEKRPSPYTERAALEHDYYEHATKRRNDLGREARSYLDIRVGRKNDPTYAVRDQLNEGRGKAITALAAANIVSQGRQGFHQKYPQGYEDHQAITNHYTQIDQVNTVATDARKTVVGIDGQLHAWQKQRDRRYGN